jgi:diguanylate cyclase (GGDEF)-like protein
MRALERFIDRASRYGEKSAMLYVDLDGLKTINDSFGHQAGDQVVAEVARRLSDVLRPSDVCGRWGGDEFIALISDVGTLGLRPIVETIRKALAGEPVELGDGRQVRFSVSAGATLVEPGDPIEVAADMADTALYRAKQQGRNRLVVFDEVWAKGFSRSA